jgi:pyrimidine-nucleoside phosphorylase
MRVHDIIRKKRDGLELAGDELSHLINGYTRGEIPDYQVSAFLMAVFLRGMTERETIDLAAIMLNSGSVLDLSDMPCPKIDKHSTGGVGDKVSIILAPLIASAGIAVPMIAGRGLGHTGGTLDKLESIPGFRTSLSITEFKEILRRTGLAVMGQTEEIAPADRKLYALRDVTATVDSIPLIASSIMSKKLAEGIQGLVLDVKVGSGAFMKTVGEARDLAKTMVKIGDLRGVKTAAILTGMEQPLGKTVGNSLEIKECISALRGKWADDLREVTLTLGAWMIELAARTSGFVFRAGGRDLAGIDEYKNGLTDLINSGAAFKKFIEMVDAQHGNAETILKPGLLPSAKTTRQVMVDREGYIRKMDAGKVGTAAMLLGAGRQKITDTVDHAAGIILNRKVGDFVKDGEQIAMFYYSDEGRVREAEETFFSGVEVGSEKPEPKSVILEVIR